MKHLKTVIGKLYVSVMFIMVTLIYTSIAIAATSPLKPVSTALDSNVSELVTIAQYILGIWFIIGVITWSIKRAHIMMLAGIPLIGWALVTGYKYLFDFAGSIFK